jgi:alanine transaminase
MRIFSQRFLMSPAAAKAKILNIHSVNQKIVAAEYAVRGKLPTRAEAINSVLLDFKQGSKSKSTELSIQRYNILQHWKSAAIGAGTKYIFSTSISWINQVIALTEYPDLMNAANLPLTSKIFPPDAIARAKEFLAAVGGSVGAYSHSQGRLLLIKEYHWFVKE